MIRLMMVLALAPGIAHADLRVECPLTLPAGAITVNAPAGWEAGQSVQFVRLIGAGMMAGPLHSFADLAPYESKPGKRASTLTWRFHPDDERWLVCSYGSEVNISKRLSGAYTQCTVRHAKDERGNVISAVLTCS